MKRTTAVLIIAAMMMCGFSACTGKEKEGSDTTVSPQVSESASPSPSVTVTTPADNDPADDNVTTPDTNDRTDTGTAIGDAVDGVVGGVAGAVEGAVDGAIDGAEKGNDAHDGVVSDSDGHVGNEGTTGGTAAR